MKTLESNAPRSPASRERSATVSVNNRSRITNGSRLGYGIDLRTRSGRRWRDLLRYYMAETGGRNETLVRTLATLVVTRERLDSAVARGEPVDVSSLIRVSGAISRLTSKLGLVVEAPPEDGTQAAIRALREEART
ncbi:MAG: hypothetical protein ACRECX_13505 [Methyloceanibacter sp.]|uniref:hypothetical protein n=1 Tax=Methyloceanibacter sp. TaxID=1965321 RepID=UPI003D6D3001